MGRHKLNSLRGLLGDNGLQVNVTDSSPTIFFAIPCFRHKGLALEQLAGLNDGLFEG